MHSFMGKKKKTKTKKTTEVQSHTVLSEIMVLVSFSMLVLCKPWFYSAWVVMTCVNSWGSAKIARAQSKQLCPFLGLASASL